MLGEDEEVVEIDEAVAGEVAVGPLGVGGVVVLGEGEEVVEVDDAAVVGVAVDREADGEAVLFVDGAPGAAGGAGLDGVTGLRLETFMASPRC